MTDVDDFDRQLREIAHRAFAEMSATHARRRPFIVPEPRRRTVAPLSLAVGLAAAIALAAPLFFAHGLRGGSAGGNQPSEVTKPADAVLLDMTAAMSRLHSYHLIERGTASDGSPVVIDLRVDHVGSAIETWTMGSETDSVVIWHGDLFVRGPSVVPGAMKAAVGDHWLGMRASGYTGTLAATVSPAHVIDCLTGDHGTLTKEGVHVVDDTRALRVVSTATTPDTRSFALDVAVDGTPYALHMETDAGPSPRPECQGPTSPTSDTPATPASGGSGHQVIDFDSFNTADLITPPADVVDSAAIAPANG